MPDGTSTHDVELGPDQVIKPFRCWDRGEPAREWGALLLLNEFAPGLAPAPLEVDLAGDPPQVTMSRRPGVPWGSGAGGPAPVESIAAAVGFLHRCVPAAALAATPLRVWSPAEAIAQVRSSSGELPTVLPDPVVQHACREGARWLDGSSLDAALAADFDPVLGQADGNLANFLWDGIRVRSVDFEDSGRSDRAFELADFVEHVSGLVTDDLDSDKLVEAFDLDPATERRLHKYRRLMTCYWLRMLLPDGPAHLRKPSGSLHRQATRVLERLASVCGGLRPGFQHNGASLQNAAAISQDCSSGDCHDRGMSEDGPFGDLSVTDVLVVPARALQWRFSRSSGPGGQGVNTADSRVELSVHVPTIPGWPEPLIETVLDRLGDRLIDGTLTVAASEYRQQLRNREAARARIVTLLREAVRPAGPRRRPTKPSRGARERRLDDKRRRSRLKQDRRAED